ncbi:MAG TPA: hypothetical protein VG602_01375 [Actinomycetota bacterium]|nr:hypothetical protein [Actinomycetota bacterium]
MNAYVLVQTDGRDQSIADEIRTLPCVVSAEPLSGPFDAIALTSAGSTPHPIDEVVRVIQGLPGVIRALPAPVAGQAA